jgi:sugar lactone lactonase YvrE
MVARSVEAGGAPLAASFRKAASGFLGRFEPSGARMAVRVETVSFIGASAARVGFTLRVRGGLAPYAQRFTGAAVHRGGAWKVAWTTACFVAETHKTPCPRPPAGVLTLPLPEERLPARFARPTALGLIRPQGLAVASDGSLLIVDASRDQVLRRLPDGRLEVFAGTGEVGFGGDDGEAVAAQLSGPSALTVASDGTVYVADTGNGRVRAVTPNGRIRSLPGRFDQPDGLALAPNGDLYVATQRSVVRVRPNGSRAVFVTGQGRFDQVSVGTRRYGAFGPSYLALDAAGDLYAFSFAAKTIFEFSPSGTPLQAWQDYADGLAAAPDGSVVVAEHGTALQRLRNGRLTPIFDFQKDTLAGFPRAGTSAGSFDPDGVAVAPDGKIYTDTFVGNGWTNQTALAEVTAPGHGRLLTTTSPLARTLPAVGAPGFPARLYPAPLPARAGVDPGGCPSPAGLHRFSARARSEAVTIAERIDVAPLRSGLRRSDRAWWHGLYTDQINGQYEQSRHRILSVTAAAADPYSAAVTRACGETLLEESLAITVGPGVYSDQVSHLYFLDRNGRPLLYWQHT